MKRALWVVACIAAAGPATAQSDPAETLPVDRAAVVQGLEAACTGLGKPARENPAWDGFPARVEFTDTKSQYVTDVEIRVVTAKGKPVLHASCGAPWVLLRLAPGDYRVSGHLMAGGPERSAAFKVPKTGQARVALTFPAG